MTRVTITTSQPLTTAQRIHLLGKLEKKHGKVDLVEIVDPSVGGGVRLTLESREYDSTIKSKLLKLRDKLLQNG